jgi:tetratricopeptide (TPR) repeat protein
MAHFSLGNNAGLVANQRRNAAFLADLPYCEELRSAFYRLFWYSAYTEIDPEAALRWLEILRRKAEPLNDLKAVAQVHRSAGILLAQTGDLNGGIERMREAVAVISRTGDSKHTAWFLVELGELLVGHKDVDAAWEPACEVLRLLDAIGQKSHLAVACRVQGWILLSQNSPEQAIPILERARQMEGIFAPVVLGCAYLDMGEREQALQQFQEAVVARTTQQPSMVLAHSLAGLEEAGGDLRALRDRLRADDGDRHRALSIQWSLEPAVPQPFPRLQFHETFVAAALSPEWRWHDPFGDCSFATGDGLAVRTANGRGLHILNQSAPRLLRPAEGHFAIQTTCVPTSGDRPASGGLLLWKDRGNFLCLDRGAHGAGEITFRGCVNEQFRLVGRGRLTEGSLLLRLERHGDQVRALGSADGESWFTAGETTFAVSDPVEVGLYGSAISHRSIYPGGFPDGTAIGFEEFQIWC